MENPTDFIPPVSVFVYTGAMHQRALRRIEDRRLRLNYEQLHNDYMDTLFRALKRRLNHDLGPRSPVWQTTETPAAAA